MTMRLSGLRTNALANPLGIDTAEPEFSWQRSSTETGSDRWQAAYELQVAAAPLFDDGLVWQSGPVSSPRQHGVRYAGRELQSFKRYYWRVRTRDTGGGVSDWSAPAWFETGNLHQEPWSASWIGENADPDKDDRGVLYLRTCFKLPTGVVHARAYVSALGWYRFFVNGRNISGSALVPRWTPLDHEVEYQAYDVGAALREGANVLAIAVGSGRFKGSIGLGAQKNTYGDRLAGFLQLHLELADGSTRTVVTDARWTAGRGRILAADPQEGEQVDLRIQDEDWLSGEQAPARFALARVLPAAGRRLIGESVERVEAVQRRRALSIVAQDGGRQLVDFGQNFAGVVRIRLRGPSGAVVQLDHSEVLRKDGTLDTTYLAVAGHKPVPQRDRIVLDGQSQWFEPWFTIHGFRYLEVSGLAEPLSLDDVEGVVLSTNMQISGSFDCSDSRLNRLYQNVLWSLRSNFTDTPTDCPTRERAGWTGDTQIFAPTATLFANVQPFLRRYLHNLRIEQYPDGRVPHLIPSETSRFSGGPNRAFRLIAASCGWSDASVLLPWTLFQYYGDESILEAQYDSMKRWVDYMELQARTKRGRGRWFTRSIGPMERYIFASGLHFGEWLRPGEGPREQLKACLIPSAVVATAYFCHSSRLLGKVAAHLGHDEDAARYAALAENVRIAWRKAFVRPDGRIGDDRQDDYVRALTFELLPPQQRQAAFDRLVRLIEAAGDHLDTGFLSTPMLLPLLAEYGRPDLSYRLLMQTSNPSWLYQIEKGATTIWETWEGHDEDGNAKASHNHYALGAAASWLVQGICGITPASPGYRRVRIAPCVGGGLTRAAASVDTPFGKLTSTWEVEQDQVLLQVSLPLGTVGEIRLGDGGVEMAGPGTHAFRWSLATASDYTKPASSPTADCLPARHG